MAKNAVKSASATDMFAFVEDTEPLIHGGDLAAARRLFPAAPRPFVDLSTGINPYPYRAPRLPGQAHARLPDADAMAALAKAAAQAYGAPSAAHVVCAPGTQILLPLVSQLLPPGRAAIVGPTYGEFARAAALAGHRVAALRDIAAAGDAQLVFVCNPNNPDGRLFAKHDLIALGRTLRTRDGVLVVDEAFMDVGPAGQTLAAEVDRGGIVVLRSFGKFFGLAGLRLGFALAAPRLAARIAALLGPWAVSGPALAIGAAALADQAWIDRTRKRLGQSAKKLDTVLSAAGLDIIGGTSLFRLVRTPHAGALFDHLGRAGILVRRFPQQKDRLRFGLPANAPAWRRLQTALAGFRPTG
jgi:cobalamin biosynthetic protein CobC